MQSSLQSHAKAGVWWEKMEPIGRERGKGLVRKCSEQKGRHKKRMRQRHRATKQQKQSM